MYCIKVSDKCSKIFLKEEHYRNYQDYLEQGLKVVGRTLQATCFNDNAQLIKTINDTTKEVIYVLHKDGKTFNNLSYMQKYIELAEQETK